MGGFDWTEWRLMDLIGWNGGGCELG